VARSSSVPSESPETAHRRTTAGSLAFSSHRAANPRTRSYLDPGPGKPHLSSRTDGWLLSRDDKSQKMGGPSSHTMSRPTLDQKRHAGRARQWWERVSDAVGVATAGAAIGTGRNPVIQGELLKIGGYLFVLTRGLAAEAGRTEQDPARKDFVSATYAVPRRLDQAVFAEGPITTPALAFGTRAIVCTSLLRAMVRALERPEGARLQNAHEYMEARRREAVGFAVGGGESLHALADAADDLAQAIARERETSTSEDEAERQRFVLERLDADLPDASLAALYRAGIRIDEIRVRVRGVARVPTWSRTSRRIFRERARQVAPWRKRCLRAASPTKSATRHCLIAELARGAIRDSRRRRKASRPREGRTRCAPANPWRRPSRLLRTPHSAAHSSSRVLQ
jgi:hypothetical protein